MPDFPDATPPMSAPSAAGLDPNRMAQLKAALDQIAPAFGKMMQQRQQNAQSIMGGVPGVSGGPPRDVTNPLNAPPTPLGAKPNYGPGATASLASNPLASGQSPTYTPTAGPSIPGIGLEFATKKAASTATASAIMQDLSNLANQVKEREHKKKVSEAEYLLRELKDAKDSGDNARHNEILADPKLRKVLKEIEGYVPFEINEKPPGVIAAEKLAQSQGKGPGPNRPSETGKLSYTQTVPQQTQGVQAQTQAIQSGNEQTIAQEQQRQLQDPLMRQAAATGSFLGAQEQRQQELWKAGFGLTAAEQKEMELKLGAQNTALVERLNNSYAIAQMHYETIDKTAMLKAKTDIEREKIAAAPHWEQVRITGEMKLQAMKAIQDKDLSGLFKSQMDGYNRLIKSEADVIKSQSASDEAKAEAQQGLTIAKKGLAEVQTQLDSWTTQRELDMLGVPVMSPSDMTGGRPASEPTPQAITPAPTTSEE